MVGARRSHVKVFMLKCKRMQILVKIYHAVQEVLAFLLKDLERVDDAFISYVQSNLFITATQK